MNNSITKCKDAFKLFCVSAGTAIMTGCATMGGNSQSQAPTYEGYIDPKAEDCKLQMEYYTKQGKIVEPVPVQDPNTQKTIMVYGIRSKNGWEKIDGWVDSSRKYREGLHWVTQDTTAVVGTVYEAKQAHGINKVANRLEGVQGAIYNQTSIQKSAAASLTEILKNRSSSCNE